MNVLMEAFEKTSEHMPEDLRAMAVEFDEKKGERTLSAARAAQTVLLDPRHNAQVQVPCRVLS